MKPSGCLICLVLLACLGCRAAVEQQSSPAVTSAPAATASPLPSSTPQTPTLTRPPATFAPPVNKNAAFTQTAEAVQRSLNLTPTLTRTPWPQDAAKLRDLAEKRGFYIGAAIQSGLLQNGDYARTLAGEFNILTPEYEMKMCVIWPERNRFDFTASDAIVQFAVDHHMRVRGHTLVWTECIPDWVSKGKFSKDQAKDLLHQYINTVVGRYKGKIQYWDVLNEAVERSPLWENLIGHDYAKLAFEWAHEADPDALLFYNDYDAEQMNPKSDAIYDLMKAWKESGVPIHGVGFQSHFKTAFDAASVAENMARLNALGLQVHITELDFPYPGGVMQPEVLQAQVYGSLLKVCLQAASCPVFVMWGFTDQYSYLNGVGVSPHPLIFDEFYKPKPSYASLFDALSAK